MVTLIHFRDRCIGCNSCVELDPVHWKIKQKDGKATLQQAKKKGDNYVLKINQLEVENAITAAQNCPVNIIKIMP